jgi:acyl-CoA synthetase (AMP-forming)/AMP-acid ligase II
MLGYMQDWDLRVSHLIDYAAREHGNREILTRWADGSIERTNWAGVALEARKLAQVFARWGMKPGDCHLCHEPSSPFGGMVWRNWLWRRDPYRECPLV